MKYVVYNINLKFAVDYCEVDNVREHLDLRESEALKRVEDEESKAEDILTDLELVYNHKPTRNEVLEDAIAKLKEGGVDLDYFEEIYFSNSPYSMDEEEDEDENGNE